MKGFGFCQHLLFAISQQQLEIVLSFAYPQAPATLSGARSPLFLYVQTYSEEPSGLHTIVRYAARPT